MSDAFHLDVREVGTGRPAPLPLWQNHQGFAKPAPDP